MLVHAGVWYCIRTVRKKLDLQQRVSTSLLSNDDVPVYV